LRDLQEEKLDLRLVSPYRFLKPLAPGVQNYAGKQRPTLKSAMGFIDTLSDKIEVLLIEGCGGLMVPLGPNFLVSDLIVGLNCPVLLVAPNRLGVINHVSLNLRVLTGLGCRKIGVVLNEDSKGNVELKRSNGTFLRKSIHPKPLISLGFIGSGAKSVSGVKNYFKNVKISLALRTGFDSLLELFGTHEGKNGEPQKTRLTAGMEPDNLVS
jgi:dethiobiotin synthase